MKRFFRYHRQTQAELQQLQERRAWGSFSVSGVLLLGGSLALLPLHGEISSLSDAVQDFICIPVEPPPSKLFQRQYIKPSIITTPAIPEAIVTQLPQEELIEIATEEFETESVGFSLIPDEGIEQPRKPQPPTTRKKATRQPSPVAKVQAAQPLHTPQPPYPESLKQKGLEGTVRLVIQISAQGIPTSVKADAGSAHPGFEEATKRWVLQHWRFSPARHNETPQASEIRTSIRFCLH